MATAGYLGTIRGTAGLAAIAPDVGIEMLVIRPILSFEISSITLMFLRSLAFMRLDQVALMKPKNIQFNMIVRQPHALFSMSIAKNIVQKIWSSCTIWPLPPVAIPSEKSNSLRRARCWTSTALILTESATEWMLFMESGIWRALSYLLLY